MKTLQKWGGFSAFYLAISYLTGLVIFIFVLNVLETTNPVQELALLVEHTQMIFLTNLLMYVFFGIFLVVLSLALFDRLKTGAPALMQVATAIGVIWAGSLIASGMVANAGIDPVLALYAKDPVQAVWVWQTIDTISSGLGNGNGEILGGVWVLLVSLAGLRSGGLPKLLNLLGILIAGVGILTLIPGLTYLVSVFGLSQLIWFVWLGIVLLRSDSGMRASIVR